LNWAEVVENGRGKGFKVVAAAVRRYKPYWPLMPTCGHQVYHAMRRLWLAIRKN